MSLNEARDGFWDALFLSSAAAIGLSSFLGPRALCLTTLLLLGMTLILLSCVSLIRLLIGVESPAK